MCHAKAALRSELPNPPIAFGDHLLSLLKGVELEVSNLNDMKVNRRLGVL